MVSRRSSTIKLLSLDPLITINRIVDSGKDLCIEGSPRSGNTYAVECIRDSNPELRIARHIHLPGQVLEAARLDIPTGVVIRNPVEAVVSRIAFSSGAIDPRRFLRHWIRFHEPMAELLEDGKIALLPFDRVIEDPAFVVETLNGRFGTELAPPTSSPERLLVHGGNRPSKRIWASPRDRLDAVERVERLKRTPEARSLYEDLLSINELMMVASPSGSSN